LSIYKSLDQFETLESPDQTKALNFIFGPMIDPIASITCFIFTLSPGAINPLHSHGESTEIYFPLKGRALLMYEGTEHLLEPGRITILSPKVPHEMAAAGDEPFCCLIIHTPAADLSHLQEKWGYRWKK
jgi:quercetin dioxygenase-like cupin family protein